jgi:hypothetical protein
VGVGTPDGKLGISVFDAVCACADLHVNCICAHISRWYSDIFPEPCAFWAFETETLLPPNPNPAKIPEPVLVKSPSTSGDECHHTIHQLSDSRAKKIFDNHAHAGQLGICVDGRGVPFDAGLASDLKKQHYPDPA